MKTKFAHVAAHLVEFVALAALLGTCTQQDTILLVAVGSPTDITPNQFRVTIGVGILNEARSFMVPLTPTTPLALPQSFTIELSPPLQGPIMLEVDALSIDPNGVINTIGAGTTVMQHIQLGGQTVIAVMLAPPLPPDTLPDGGTDGPMEAPAETSGGAGSSASSTDGATDVDAEGGLDGKAASNTDVDAGAS